MTRIAIIGAGMAGLTLAESLGSRHEVTLFEKSRGVSGRMSARTAGAYRFDHGAQYFTARSDAFREFLAPHIAAGSVAVWNPVTATMAADGTIQTFTPPDPHYVGVPGMNALNRSRSSGLDIRLETEIRRLERGDANWRLEDGAGNVQGDFDWVVSTVPAPQAIRILPANFTGLDRIDAVSMVGCFTLMIGLPQDPVLPFDSVRVTGSPVGWIGRNGSKPGREGSFTLVVNSDNDWAEAHLEDEPDSVRATLLAETSRLTGIDLSTADYLSMHRWRYADTRRPLAADCLVDPDLQLAACGDWCLAGRVEAAFLSARATAAAINDRIGQ